MVDRVNNIVPKRQLFYDEMDENDEFVDDSDADPDY